MPKQSISIGPRPTKPDVPQQFPGKPAKGEKPPVKKAPRPGQDLPDPPKNPPQR